MWRSMDSLADTQESEYETTVVDNMKTLLLEMKGLRQDRDVMNESLKTLTTEMKLIRQEIEFCNKK